MHSALECDCQFCFTDDGHLKEYVSIIRHFFIRYGKYKNVYKGLRFQPSTKRHFLQKMFTVESAVFMVCQKVCNTFFSFSYLSEMFSSKLCIYIWAFKEGNDKMVYNLSYELLSNENFGYSQQLFLNFNKYLDLFL